MKTLKSILIKYLISWIFLSVIYFFLSEKIARLIAPGFDNVELWIVVVIAGLSAIFLIMLISFFIAFMKFKKQRQLK
jgi:hypothetical protein